MVPGLELTHERHFASANVTAKADEKISKLTYYAFGEYEEAPKHCGGTITFCNDS